MKMYSNDLYELQKEYSKQVNLMLKDDLRSDFKELFDMLEAKGCTNKEKKYECNDGRLVAWVNSKSSGLTKELFIETQSCLFIVELKSGYERKPEININYVPYEEREKKYFGTDKSIKIYSWYDSYSADDDEFNLSVCNRNEIIAHFRAINSFLINWESLHCCLTNDLGYCD